MLVGANGACIGTRIARIGGQWHNEEVDSPSAEMNERTGKLEGSSAWKGESEKRPKREGSKGEDVLSANLQCFS